MQDKNNVQLGVNIDHVATIRQLRGTIYPDLIEVADIVEKAGADAITIHLREDRRHIQDQDVYDLRKTLNTRMNLELAATSEMVEIACKVQPEDVCVVPEKREELTTEGGLDVIGNFDRIQKYTKQLSVENIQVSLFIEPDLEQIKKSLEAGARVIELHTGTYANASGDERKREFDRILQAAEFADSEGIRVNAGHGLDYVNTKDIAQIPQMKELNIGHSIIARSVFVGISEATREIKEIIRAARNY